MKRLLETGNGAITEGAIIAGCRVFAGYPITPATEIAENMARRLPRAGGFYLQAEDELAALYICIGASAGGMKAMTATSGPGYILYADPFGWAISSEIPLVIVNSQRVGPVSGITGAPGQGEFYLSRYLTHGGNFENIVLAPAGVQEAFAITVQAFYLAERFRMPVTILADQLVTDGWETLLIPETGAELDAMGLKVIERRVNRGPEFYPATDAIDVPPVVLGHNTGAACSDWTPTAEGYDTEEVEWQHKHAYRLIYKVRNHKDLLTRYEAYFVDDEPEVILVAYGSPSRVVKSAVKVAREQGLKVGGLRLVTLWPFPEEIFSWQAKYLVVEMNYDGQLVREVQRATPKGSAIHFLGKCGELPRVAELVELIRALVNDRPLPCNPREREVW
ncbi:2-oxoglutarate ferredoxin oxidoreductase subunit alpha [Neomoorella thermoacetica]|uniref:2-oxoglutarate ferredoxin oxidoreductase subunit alpha n=1 Tax=Neomoorella thermoacetica TaxID=1525 RepID=UPI0008FAE8D3|nr:2-oxoglutarate ferredoxin oxidoreductase subunit alpha [Moorella thermoacetica]OIQ54699.1 2-oxoglutarate oxidoreductase subunit KorA [Moorella thermoacetica]